VNERQLKRQARERYAVASRVERDYLRNIRKLTNQIDHMVKGMVNIKMTQYELERAQARLQAMLRQYGETITPWAESAAEKMVKRVESIDENNWTRLGKQINRSLRKELQDAPVGETLRSFMAEQVVLIKSLPIEAAERVHKMTLEGITTGERASSIAAKILETGSVTKSRAQLIARTEVARTASGLTMARSKHVGATHYYWRTSGDGDVRASHKKFNGRIIAWDDPPEVDPGYRYHAGMFPNCRCYPEPILEEEL
jgi:SPP1 gp7 family putative phage head morphogenesis protein